MNGDNAHTHSPLVLVIDDDRALRLMLRELLTLFGFTVEEAADGRRGLDSFIRMKPDIVLLDAMMPEMDGFSVCVAIRALPEGEHVPVVMMSGMEDTVLVERAFKSGATEFVTKPINWRTFSYHVRYMLRAGMAFRALRTSEIRTRALLGAIPDQLLHIGSDGVFLDCNLVKDTCLPGFPADIAGKSLQQVLPDETAALFMMYVEQAIRSGKVQIFEYRQMINGRHHEFEVRILCCDGSEVVAVIRDISERKLSEEKIRNLACYDNLTGLPNRLFFRDLLSRAMFNARRCKQFLVIMFLDLDDFKRINDTLGHAVGDKLLKKVAERLTRSVRHCDYIFFKSENFLTSHVSRFGGDEFTILLNNVTSVEMVAKVAQRIIRTVSKVFRLDGNELFISASVGITIFPLDAEDVDALLKNADIAMYSAKEKGRNTYQFFSNSMNETACELLALENSMHRALERSEFFLNYQPQIDIATGRIVGMEALLRWNHPEMGVIPPDKFIPLAEKNGLISPIGAWVLRTACSQCRKWQMAGLGPLRMAVNISGQQLHQRSLTETVSQALRESGLEPHCLDLELTESMLMGHTEANIATMRALKELGVRISIDDFGTGYSSLSYLKRFPLDALKIDRSFVGDIITDQDDAAITMAIIAMAHNLKLKVIAEGVENAEQFALLRKLGCDEAQGYLFSRPVSAAEVIILLKHDNEISGWGASVDNAETGICDVYQDV